MCVRECAHVCVEGGRLCCTWHLCITDMTHLHLLPPAQAKANPEVLKQQVAIKSIQNVLQTNVNVCTSLGQPFMSQFNFIYADMLQVRGRLAQVQQGVCVALFMETSACV